MRIEFQIHDDKYIKCVLVDLTDGEGGVWARKVGTSYRAASRSVKVGCHFGDVTRNDGYEVYGLFAAPSEPNPLPIIPQPTEWKPSAGECDLASAKVEVKVDASSGLGEEGNPTWEDFARIADSLNEPKGVKSTHKSKVKEYE